MNQSRPPHVFAELLAEPAWAVIESSLFAWLDSMRELAVAPDAAYRGRTPPQGGAGAVAVVPVTGMIIPRAGSWLEDEGFATSAETITRRVRAAAADPHVKSIVLDVNSPGGVVSGVQSAAAAVLEARAAKRVEAVASPLMASAAYWIASGAHRITTDHHGYVGSIGVFTTHFDQSEMFKRWGVTPTVVRAGDYKAEDLPFAPLTDAAKAAMQERVNGMYDGFVDHVAKARGVTGEAIRTGYGRGRALVGRRAVESGLADDVGTLDQVLARLGGEKQGINMPAASSDADDAKAIRELAKFITGGSAK